MVIPANAASSIVADTEELVRIERRMADGLRAGGSRGEVFGANPRFITSGASSDSPMALVLPEGPYSHW